MWTAWWPRVGHPEIRSSRWTIAVPLIFLVVLAFIEFIFSGHFGLWIDEIYTLWATDPSVPLSESIDRITGDTNPPLYYFLIRLLRTVVSSRTTWLFVVADSIFLALTASYVLFASRKSQHVRETSLALAAFALCGFTYFYFQEGRAYFLGACVTFTIAWRVALLLEQPEGESGAAELSLLGVIGSLVHLY